MRQRLIQVAIEKFGKQGFEGTGTREIALAADTAMSSITYHFGSKDGLYAAAAEHIFSHLQEFVGDPSMGELEHATVSGTDNEARLQSICDMLRRVGQFMLRDQSAAFSLFISREQQEPSPIMRGLIRTHIERVVSPLVGQVELLCPDLNLVQARATAFYLFGLPITLRHSRASLCAMMEVESIDADLGKQLLHQLEVMIRAILDGAA